MLDILKVLYQERKSRIDLLDLLEVYNKEPKTTAQISGRVILRGVLRWTQAGIDSWEDRRVREMKEEKRTAVESSSRISSFGDSSELLTWSGSVLPALLRSDYTPACVYVTRFVFAPHLPPRLEREVQLLSLHGSCLYTVIWKKNKQLLQELFLPISFFNLLCDAALKSCKPLWKMNASEVFPLL